MLISLKYKTGLKAYNICGIIVLCLSSFSECCETIICLLSQLPVNPLPMFSASWRKLALTVNYSKYKVVLESPL